MKRRVSQRIIPGRPDYIPYWSSQVITHLNLAKDERFVLESQDWKIRDTRQVQSQDMPF